MKTFLRGTALHAVGTFYAIVGEHLLMIGAVGDERVVNAQKPADAAAAALRSKQSVSEVAMDVQIRLHVQLGEAKQRQRRSAMMMMMMMTDDLSSRGRLRMQNHCSLGCQTGRSELQMMFI